MLAESSQTQVLLPIGTSGGDVRPEVLLVPHVVVLALVRVAADLDGADARRVPRGNDVLADPEVDLLSAAPQSLLLCIICSIQVVNDEALQCLSLLSSWNLHWLVHVEGREDLDLARGKALSIPVGECLAGSLLYQSRCDSVVAAQAAQELEGLAHLVVGRA